MKGSWDLPLTFSYHVYPTLGIYNTPTESLKASTSKQIAQTIIHYFQSPPAADSLKHREKLWNPSQMYWNLTDIPSHNHNQNQNPDIPSSLIPAEGLNKEVIFDEKWLEKLASTPAVALALYEYDLGDNVDEIISRIKMLESSTSLFYMHVVIPFAPANLEASASQHLPASRITKEALIDSSKLLIYPQGNQDNTARFLTNLEKSLIIASANYYSRKIAKRQHKITLQRPLVSNDRRNSLESEEVANNEQASNTEYTKDKWYFYGRGKLIRHYIKLSYYAECCGETELKKWCIKEAYRQIQIYSKEVTESSMPSATSAEISFAGQNAKSLYENAHWAESLLIMNHLCARMEREAIRELQESPRAQHLQNVLQILDIPKSVDDYYKYFILAQSLELLLPIYDLVFQTGTELTKATIPKHFDQILLEVLPIEIKHIGFLKYYIATMFIRCVKDMRHAGLQSFSAIICGKTATVSINSISERALHHLTESKNTFTNRLWLVRLDTMIAKCLFMVGNDDLGIKKMISASNEYREQRWKNLLYKALKLMVQHSSNETKLLCLLEMSAIEKSTQSAKSWMEFLDSEQLEITVDSNSTTPVISCHVKFVDVALTDDRNAAFDVYLTSALPIPIVVKSLTVKLDPPTAGSLIVNNITVGDKPVRLVGIATMPPNSLSVSISQSTATLKGAKGSVSYVWTIPSNRHKATWRYVPLNRTLDFEFSNINAFSPAFAGETLPVELKVSNNSLVNVGHALLELSFVDELSENNITSTTIELGTLQPKSVNTIVYKLAMPNISSPQGFLLIGVLKGELAGLPPLSTHKTNPVSVTNPLKITCKQLRAATEVGITNISKFQLSIALPTQEVFVLDPQKQYKYPMLDHPESLSLVCRRLAPDSSVAFEGFSTTYNFLYETQPNLLSVDLSCDTAFIQGKPSQLQYLITNPSKYSVKLMVNMTPTEGVVFSGHKTSIFRLLPNQTYRLTYTVVFLACRNELPKLNISLVSELPPPPTPHTQATNVNYNTVRVPIKSDRIVNNVIRNDKSSVIVIPN